ncbi:2'-5'-oligoadenylate synthase 1A [Lemmus lemmus]
MAPKAVPRSGSTEDGAETQQHPGLELDKFIEDHLIPDSNFCDEVTAATNIICTSSVLNQQPCSSHCLSLLSVRRCWGSRCPLQYALELLTVYAWKRGSGITEFNTAQSFRTVLEPVTKYRELRIYWTEYYEFQHPDISYYTLCQLTRAS